MFDAFTRLRAFLASILLPARAWTGAAWGVNVEAEQVGVNACDGFVGDGGGQRIHFWGGKG